MKDNGFPLEEETYGPFLAYLIDMAMVEEFFFFCDVIKDANPSSVSKLGYYEMLLWIKVDNEEKIQELCDFIVSEEGLNESSLQGLFFCFLGLRFFSRLLFKIGLTSKYYVRLIILYN